VSFTGLDLLVSKFWCLNDNQVMVKENEIILVYKSSNVGAALGDTMAQYVKVDM